MEMEEGGVLGEKEEIRQTLTSSAVAAAILDQFVENPELGPVGTAPPPPAPVPPCPPSPLLLPFRFEVFLAGRFIFIHNKQLALAH